MNYDSALYIGSNHAIQAINLHLCIPVNVSYIYTLYYIICVYIHAYIDLKYNMNINLFSQV